MSWRCHGDVMTHCRRIVMLLSGDWSFAPSLRAPAISRLQKIHNVELVFRQLTQRGFDLKTPKGKRCLFPWQLAYWLPFAVLLLALGAVAVLAVLWHAKFCSVIVLGFKLSLSLTRSIDPLCWWAGSVLNARDIVDGHREKTLAFLWKLIFHFQVRLSSLLRL